ncbi:enolase C-terminal domain-like protein [Streptosporangium sp. CA-115845]|uniref:enolase C-terminal domain-like protein n=1 Tax=Streptosporangium sp. CA-115845 TaxID=3240071 RepID=UPI003D913BA5
MRAIVGDAVTDLHGLTGVSTREKSVDRVLSPFEVACLDIRGRAAGVPVCDLLGGRVREAVPYSAYLFYKRAGHPGGDPDRFGAALDTDGLLAQARLLVEEYGFASIKVKGGVFPPEEESEALAALAEAFPGLPLRLDPNAAWSVETSVAMGARLEGLVEYLEDPTPGLEGMAQVAARVPMPLARPDGLLPQARLREDRGRRLVRGPHGPAVAVFLRGLLPRPPGGNARTGAAGGRRPPRLDGRGPGPGDGRRTRGARRPLDTAAVTGDRRGGPDAHHAARQPRPVGRGFLRRAPLR